MISPLLVKPLVVAAPLTVKSPSVVVLPAFHTLPASSTVKNTVAGTLLLLTSIPPFNVDKPSTDNAPSTCTSFVSVVPVTFKSTILAVSMLLSVEFNVSTLPVVAFISSVFTVVEFTVSILPSVEVNVSISPVVATRPSVVVVPVTLRSPATVACVSSADIMLGFNLSSSSSHIGSPASSKVGPMRFLIVEYSHLYSDVLSGFHHTTLLVVSSAGLASFGRVTAPLNKWMVFTAFCLIFNPFG